jgi:hypothetical protein
MYQSIELGVEIKDEKRKLKWLGSRLIRRSPIKPLESDDRATLYIDRKVLDDYYLNSFTSHPILDISKQPITNGCG